jgi:hypothetical protein
MHRLLQPRQLAVVVLAVAASFLGAASPAFAQGWTYSATYPNHASCLAAGKANPQGLNWRCVVSAQPGAFDLYLWG